MEINMELRILDEPLMTVGLGVAFAKADTRGICQKVEQTLADMKEDGTAAKIIGKYLDDPEKYLEVDKIGEE
jgi:polar amino acid transport system substrate-binding protein